MRYGLFTIIISLMLINSLAVFAHEESDEPFLCCYEDNEYEWETESECLEDGGELVSSDNCEEFGSNLDEREDDFDEEFSCESREECMELCRMHPKRCKFEYEERMDDERAEERLKIRGEYGNYKYKYKSKYSGGEEVEVEFEGRGYFNYFEEKPEHFIIAKMTEGMTPEEAMRFPQMCPDVEGMVDALINHLKESGRWNIERTCNGIDNELNRCKEESPRQCENIKKAPWFRFNEEEVTCDGAASKDRFYDLCLKKMYGFDEEFDNVEEICERNWDNLEEQCERKREHCEEFEREVEETTEEVNNVCERDEGCLRDMAEVTGMSIAITPDSVGCDLGPECNREEYMERCKSEFGTGVDTAREKMREKCNRMSEEMLQNFRKSCEGRDHAYNKCLEHSQKHCGVLERVKEKCTSINEERLRNVVTEQGRKVCKFMENEDEFVNKMLKAKGHFRNGEYDIIIEEEAEAVSEGGEEADEIEDKSFGYKVKKFFCLAADEERVEAARLREISTKFKAKAELMVDLGEEAETAQGKTVLLEAAVSLEEESKHLEKWSEEKKEKAAGLCSVFSSNEEEVLTES